MSLVGILCLIGVCSGQVSPAGTAEIVTSPSDDLDPYHGAIGPDSILYGLKIAIENLDESFVPGEAERLEKRAIHASLRLAEVRKELLKSQDGNVERALEQYMQKLNSSEGDLARYRANATGLLQAERIIARNQMELEDLLHSHPNHTGLVRAYNTSHILTKQFEVITAIKFERVRTGNGEISLRLVKLEIHGENESGEDGDVEGEDDDDSQNHREKVVKPTHTWTRGNGEDDDGDD
jgi:hypothetical protein